MTAAPPVRQPASPACHPELAEGSLPLPVGWTETRLLDVTRHHSGNGKLIKGKLSNEPGNGLFPAFSATGQDVWRDGFESDGDAVIVSAVGARCGKCFLASGKWSAIANTHVVWPKPEAIDRKFLWYRINDERFWIRSGSAQPFVVVRKSFERPFALPPLPEQRRIVAEIEKQFTRLEAGVAALRRVQANLHRYRAAVLKAACEGRLVPTEAELAEQTGRAFESGAELLARVSDVAASETTPRRAGRLWGAGHVPDLTDEERLTMPRGWVWTKVRDLGFDPESAVQVGPMSMKSEDFAEDGVPVLNVGCVQWDRFAESKLDHLPPGKAAAFERYRIKPGDVLFTRSGTVGRCAVAQPHQDGWLMTFHLLRTRPNPRKCLPAFLRMVFEGAPHIRRQTKAASVGSTRAGFNTNLLANLAVPLPPVAEQERIVAEVERRLSVVEELSALVTANLQRATRLRQSILQRAFEGKLVAAALMPQERGINNYGT